MLKDGQWRIDKVYMTICMAAIRNHYGNSTVEHCALVIENCLKHRTVGFANGIYPCTHVWMNEMSRIATGFGIAADRGEPQ